MVYPPGATRSGMDSRRFLVSLFGGLVAALAVGVGVTAALDPYLWPSALVGLPAGVVAGVTALPLTYFGLAYLAERRRGRVSTSTAARLWATVAAVGAFVGAGGLAVALLWTLAVGLATALLLGGVVGVVAAAVAALAVSRRVRRRPPSPGTTAG